MADDATYAQPRAAVAEQPCPGCGHASSLRTMRSSSGPELVSCRFCAWRDLREVPGVDVRSPAVRAGWPRATTEPAWSHGVRFYTRDSDLVGTVLGFLLEAWSRGAVGLLVATPGHRAAVREQLAAQGLGAVAQNRLIELDASDTLGLFMRRGRPDETLFRQTIGALVRQHASGPPLWAFGEMVDVLCARGNALAAMQLEHLWCDLQALFPFRLLCGYADEHVTPGGAAALGRTHDAVVS